MYRFDQQSTAFNIDTNTGVITTDTLVLNIMYYHLRVVAYDSGSPQLSSNGKSEENLNNFMIGFSLVDEENVAS